MSQVAAFEIPDLGLDQDSHPRIIQRRYAPQITNLLLDRPGVARVRGPLSEGTTWSAGAAIAASGIWQLYNKLLISRNALSATATRDYWVSRYRGAPAAANLRSLQATMKLVDFDAGTVTDVTPGSATQRIGLSYVQVGAVVYGIGGDGTAGASSFPPNSFQRARSLLRWDGASTITDYAGTAPIIGQAIAYHNNRLIVLGGDYQAGAAGVTSSAPSPYNTLMWSDPISTDVVLPADINAWKDDASGLLNRLIVGGTDGTDFGVALAHVGQNLCILKRRSLWMLYGTGPSNWTLKQVQSEVGCIDPRSVVESQDGVYFMSDHGFMFFDGVQARNVSKGVQSTLVTLARNRVGDLGVDGGYCRAWPMANGYIGVQVGVVDGTSGTANTDANLYLYHTVRNTWVQASSNTIFGIVGGGRTLTNTWLMADDKIVKANYFTDPDNTPSGSEMFDTIDGNTTRNLIPASLMTRTQTIASDLTQAQLQRVVLDYEWGLNLQTSGWQTTVYTHNSAGAATNLFGRTNPDPGQAQLNLRGSFDAFGETDEVRLFFSALYPSSVNASPRYRYNELHGAFVEYNPTRRTGR